MAKYNNLIKETALLLNSENRTATFSQVADMLNSLNFKTTQNTPYSGTRGTAKIINDAYDELIEKKDSDNAKIVADSFTNKDGQNAWK